MGPHPIVELRNVRRTYKVRQGAFQPSRSLTAIDSISLSVNPGEVLGIVGESGCGKSTLARILLGLEPPDSGEVLFDGRPIQSISRSELTRRVQPVFQDPYSSLNPRKTVEALITLPLRAHGIGSAADQRREAMLMLDKVGLPSRVIHNTANQLSGGQRQRVAIARALIMKPEVIVCDEPTSALDVSVQSQILNLLADLRQEYGLTYVFISHNLAVVRRIATHVAVMYLGRSVEHGTAAQIFRSPEHPYTRALFECIPTPEPGFGVPRARIRGAPPNPLNRPSGCAFHTRCLDHLAVCSTIKPQEIARVGGGIECHLFDPALKAAEVSRQSIS